MEMVQPGSYFYRHLPDGRLPKKDLYVYGMIEVLSAVVYYVSDLFSLTNFFDAIMQWVAVDFQIIEGSGVFFLRQGDGTGALKRQLAAAAEMGKTRRRFLFE